MKKSLAILLSLFMGLTALFSQSYKDDFESYTPNDYLAKQSSNWMTWNNAPGTSEDVYVKNDKAYSGSQSLWYDSPYGNGPSDIVLDFGGVHSTGTFKFKSMWYIPSGNAAYFNFQGAATVGSIWSMDFYMYDDATFSVDNISGNYPQNKWFEIRVEIDFASNDWVIFVDGVNQGSFSAGTNAASFLDIYGVFKNSSFWVDDVSYCVDNYCNTDIAIDSIDLDPNPVCSGHGSDLTLYLTNNGPDPAKGFLLGLEMAGQNTIQYQIDLNDLAVGDDTTIVIPDLFQTYTTGSNLDVRAVNLDHDMNILNDTAWTTITVLPSPSGASLTKGSTYQGIYNSGNNAKPDVVEIGKTVSYELNPPTGYSNSNYNSTWVISSVVARTAAGNIVPATSYTTTTPGSSNGGFSFKGLAAFLDSNITFSYTVANKSTGCDSVINRVVRIVPTPKTNFTIPGIVCLGDLVEFTNTSTIHSGNMQYKWFFGDGDSSELYSPIHDYLTAGNYNVRLIATSLPYGISKDTIIAITISEIPKVAFTVLNKCEGIAVDFQNKTTIGAGNLTYNWNFGDGSANSSATNPSHLYSVTGGYKVTLQASANGCVASLTKNAYTFDKPVANFSVPTGKFCTDYKVQFNNLSTLKDGDMGQFWDFADGNNATVENPSHAFSTPGTFNVKLYAISEFGCRDTAEKNVSISEGPKASFTNSQVCDMSPTTFSNNTPSVTGAVANYNWNFGDGNSSTVKNPTHQYSTLGPKTVTLMVTLDNGCKSETSTVLNVNTQADAKFNLANTCAGVPVHFDNRTTYKQGQISYVWYFGNGDSSSDAAPVYTYNPLTTNTYNVVLKAIIDGKCATNVSKQITVFESPSAAFTVKDDWSQVKDGYRTVLVQATNTTYNFYRFKFSDGGSLDASSGKYQFPYEGDFSIDLYVRNDVGCESTSSTTHSIFNSLNTKTPMTGTFIVYPNPSSGQVNIRAGSDILKLQAIDALGHKINITSIINGSHATLGFTAAGMYVINIETATGIQSQRVIISK